jgi:tetratricopeptide (TPR) repeat protein
VWAFVAAALFALHPVHTESVAWIAAVTDLELTFFYLLTFGLFLALAVGGRHGGPLRDGVPLRGSLYMQAAMGVSFLPALLSKEQAMTLPALATVYEHFWREDRLETSTLQKLGRYGLLWLMGAAYMVFRIHFLGALAPVDFHAQLTPQQTVLSAIALVGQYVGKLLWPMRLCAFYVFHPSASPLDLGVLAGLLVLLALAALFLVCWRSRERRVRFASFGIVWFFATLAPVLNAHWVFANVFTERYLYLPSVGLGWLVGLGVSKLWWRAAARPAQRRALLLAGFMVGGLFAVRIVMRDRDWNNDIVLYNQTLELSPDAYSIQNNLGAVYWKAGDDDKAERAWRGVFARNPDDPLTLNNLGLLANRRHQYGEAKAFFQHAIELNPGAAELHLNLAETYQFMGMPDLAEPQFRAAVALSPLDTRARNELGQLLVEKGRMREAEEQFRASVHGRPTAFAYDYLGMFSYRRGDVREAERDFRAALSLENSDSYAHFGLGDILRAAGRKDEALRHYQAGLVADPTNAQARAAAQALEQQVAGSAP